jgi:hypothetical protein
MVQLQEWNYYNPVVYYYWKLDSGDPINYKKHILLEMLRDKHYTCKSRTLVRIQEHFVRCQRGLLSYEGLSIRELKLFTKQRGIPVTIGKKPTLSSLKAQLEQADDDLTFDRFSDLPPELRQKIFQQYFDPFGQYLNSSGRYGFGRPVRGGQPPITMASRQTRREALPLYYSRCQFDITRPAASNCDIMGIDENIVQKAFVQNTPIHDFALIRYFTLMFHIPRSRINRNDYVYFTVNINDDECPVKVSHFVGHEGIVAHQLDIKTSGDEVDRVNELFMLEPRAVIRSIAARGGPMKLQKNDKLLLYNSVRDALQQIKGYRLT